MMPRPVNRLFFLRPTWVACGQMVSGSITTAYAFFNVVRYGLYGKTEPLLFGKVEMAFSTASLFVVVGLSLFWDGWLIRNETFIRLPDEPLTSNQLFQLGLAFLSSMTLIVVALIALFKK